MDIEWQSQCNLLKEKKGTKKGGKDRHVHNAVDLHDPCSTYNEKRKGQKDVRRQREKGGRSKKKKPIKGNPF
jgi:hypothetical protein